MNQLKSLADVVGWRLCTGCGACAYICPSGRIDLVDFENEGIRPVLAADKCSNCSLCLAICPSVHSTFLKMNHNWISRNWGPIAGIWEGHATDPEIRYRGSSGGAITAIAAYCLEKHNMHGVLHVAQDPENPVGNRTRLSYSRSALMDAAGSRYSPASVCNGLGLVEKAPVPCVVIGRPAEIAALSNARRLRPELDKNIGLTISFFCAESPSTAGTNALLRKVRIDPLWVSSVRYRGHGWPGHFTLICKNGMPFDRRLSYRESWTILQAYRPWAAQMWPDGTGELADISCGDPWHIKPDPSSPGSSLIVARTKLGLSIVKAAAAAGYLDVQSTDTSAIDRSQPGLLLKKQSIWGRQLALRLCGLPITRFDELQLWACWTNLGLRHKARSIVGTARRVWTRKLYRRQTLDVTMGKPVNAPMLAGDRTHG